MAQFIIEINDAEEKALLTNMISIQEWLDNAIHNKARKCIDRIVEQISDKQPRKILVEEKYQIIRDAQLETAAERNARFEVELLRKRKNAKRK